MKKLLIIFAMMLLIVPLSYMGLPKSKEAHAAAYCSGRAMVVIETNENKVICSKNKDEKLAMASTTKIATAITVIDNCENLDDVVTTPKQATLTEGTSIYLREGEKLTVRQLLYGLMLQSGNDAAVALALHIGETIDTFSGLMNDVAKKAGAMNTNFTNPHGLDGKDHYTTAHDLALITSYALKNPEFKEIVSSKSYRIAAGENNTARTLMNKNRLLSSLEGCVGVKTGFTSKAGRCLVSAAERDGVQFVCVVFNCGPMFEESSDLLNEAFKEYILHEVLPSYNFISEVPVEDGLKEKVRIYNKEGYKTVIKEEDKDNFNIEYEYPAVLKAPLKKDQKIGEVKIFNNDKLIFSEDLCVIEEVEGHNTIDKLKGILDNWL